MTPFWRHNDVITSSCVQWGQVYAYHMHTQKPVRARVQVFSKLRKSTTLKTQYFLHTVRNSWSIHYSDVIMGATASQITRLTIVFSIVYSDADQRKHQSSASLAFVRWIHRGRWIPRTNGQLRGKCFHLLTSSWSSIKYVGDQESKNFDNYRKVSDISRTKFQNSNVSRLIL